MKKISKKIVALLTMAAFVLTLVPVAAFAAADTTVQTSAKDLTVNMQQGQAAKAEVTVTVGSKDANHNIFVWLTDDNNNNQIYRYAQVTGKDDVIAATGSWNGAALIGSANASENTKFTVEFTIPDAGEYTVHAGADLTDANTGNFGALTTIPVTAGYDTITVNAAATYVDSITVDGAQNQTANGGTINYASGGANGIRTTQVDVTVASKYVSNGQTASSNGKTLSIENLNDRIAVLNDEGDEVSEVTVNNNTATFYLKADAGVEGTYTLTLSADNVSYRLSVNIGDADNTAATIETVDTGKSVVATSTSLWYNLSDVARFIVKNADGEVLTPADKPDGFTAYTQNTGTNTDLISVLDQPSGVNLTGADFKVVDPGNDADYFVLQARDGSKLVPGEYTVRVSLDNNKVADVTFTVARFGKVTGLTIDMDKETVDLAGSVTGTVKYVDENGLEQDANSSVVIGYQGNACAKLDATNAPDFEVTAKDADRYIGGKITVIAVDSNYGLSARQDIIVTDGVTEGTLDFGSDNGPVYTNNTVEFSVVDEDGNVLTDVDEATIVAYVDNQSVENANVTVKGNGNVKDGKGKITVYSDKETTADIVVAVQTKDKKYIYANTLSYTFGPEDINADKMVAMTIGSSDYIVDNEIVNGDAAPYVDSNWRTMVPIRALAETFGATVDFTDNVVTIVDGDTTVVMTIGETTYTVNDEEANMDTAPVIGDGDRTYVPVRFVAEALGYTVTPLQDANGLTASVVFQK